jgi:UDP-N-acetylmuramate dehydrogenase
MLKLDLFTKKLADHALPVRKNISLAPYTTIGVGGRAHLLAEVHTTTDLELAVTLALDDSIPYLVMGRGSNLIISDYGYEGLVIVNKAAHWQILQNHYPHSAKNKVTSRFVNLEKSTDSEEMVYSDTDAEDIKVRVESGARMEFLIKALLKVGITGLQWFAGIPATIGGAVYMNIHGGDYFFSHIIEQVCLTDGRATKVVNNNYFQFDYDWSILHRTAEIVLWVDLNLKKGDVQKAGALARNWAKQKAHQPRRSAGCIFRNLTAAEQKRCGLPTSSVGYLIDKVLNLKGRKHGEAIISPKHAGFIENLGQASATDVVELINLIKRSAKEQLGLELKTEVQLIGKF